MKTRLLVSLGTLGIAGGSGVGIYYGVNGFSKNKEEKFSGYLIFSEKDKKPDSDPKMKIYEAKLSADEKSDFGDEICKLEDNKNLICKISDLINQEKVELYLKELNANIIEETTEKLQEKLKKQLETDKENFKNFFGTNIYSEIQKKLTIDS